MTIMTLEQFRATGVDCDDIGKAIGADFGDATPARGRLYGGPEAGLYIEDRGVDQPGRERWHLMLFRDEYVSFDIAELEARLYRFWLAEGFLGEIDREALKEELVEAAINAACKVVQDALGCKWGDVAGNYWSSSEARQIIADYVGLEITQGE